jgi:hypothetical protein
MGLFRRSNEQKFVEVGSQGTVYQSELPVGFFRVKLVSGKETLGYNDPLVLYTLDCGEVLVIGGKRVALSVPKEELPVVQVVAPARGNVHVLSDGRKLVDTDSLPGEFNGEYEWDGEKPLGSDGSWV